MRSVASPWPMGHQGNGLDQIASILKRALLSTYNRTLHADLSLTPMTLDRH